MGKKEILTGLAFFAAVFLFAVFVLPEAIDRELHRMEVVRQWNIDHGYAP